MSPQASRLMNHAVHIERIKADFLLHIIASAKDFIQPRGRPVLDAVLILGRRQTVEVVPTMLRVSPRTPDGRMSVLQVPVHGGYTNPDMAKRRHVTGGVFIRGNLPQLVVRVKQINPVRQPEFFIDPQHAITIAVASGFTRNAVGVDYRRIANLPFAPARLRKSEGHEIVVWEITA